MDNEKHYIVDEENFSIIKDIIDESKPICMANGTNKINGMYNYYFRGKANNSYPEGRLYLAENCFKTEEGAKNKLKTVIKYAIEQNTILIENLNGENERLNKKLNDIENGQINGKARRKMA